jgi:hypothetical protein
MHVSPQSPPFVYTGESTLIQDPDFDAFFLQFRFKLDAGLRNGQLE